MNIYTLTKGDFDMKHYIGIDLGGTFIKGGIVNELGEIVISDKTPTEVEKGDLGVAANIARLAKELLDRAGLTTGDVEGLGIGSPGMIDSAEGNVVYANNLGWENFKEGIQIFAFGLFKKIVIKYLRKCTRARHAPS